MVAATLTLRDNIGIVESKREFIAVKIAKV
jgi:hypothetical protein